jgi:hypothetical protein
VVPLCAAETPLSDYVRSFLTEPIHEKYAMGGPKLPVADNFIGARHLLDLHRLTIDLCSEEEGAQEMATVATLKRRPSPGQSNPFSRPQRASAGQHPPN